MSKGRLFFWIISFIIGIIIISFYKYNKSKIPYNEREAVKVYSEEEFKDNVKYLVEDTSFGKKHRAVFTTNKDEAVFAITDTLDEKDVSSYKKVAWSPLVVAMDKSKKKEYVKEKYIDNQDYIDFLNVINAVIAGEFKDKIYYPKLNTKEGELFKDFLIVTVNNGKYPDNNTEGLIDETLKKVNEFLSAKNTIETDTVDQIKNKQILKNEWIFIFENELYSEIDNESYDFYLGYPNNTVIHVWYYYCKNEELLKILNEKRSVWEAGIKIESMFFKSNYRNNSKREAYSTSARSNFSVKDGFTYVEIPINSSEKALY